MAGPAENLGETLVPVVNRLQDIFSQVQSRGSLPCTTCNSSCIPALSCKLPNPDHAVPSHT